MPVAVVTDSTAYLPAAAADGVTVVPLTVTASGRSGAEGEEISPTEVARALLVRPQSVTTSRPAPARFAQVYRQALAAGASAVVSVHLSAQLSGTHAAAELAAAEVDPAKIVVVDAGSTGMGLGFCVLAARTAACQGGCQLAVAQAARAAADRTTTFFYVDTLEFLRRGGRIGAASALMGTALSVKPILCLRYGRITVHDRVRTTARALDRLVSLAVEAAGESVVDLAVHHSAALERATAVTNAVVQRLGDQVRHCWHSEVGAVVAAHVGPGLAGVVVHRTG